MKHFIKETDIEYSPFKTTLMAILSFPLLFTPFFIFYEMWAEPHYWKNRWKLHHLLNKGHVKVKELGVSPVFHDNIVMYDILIDDTKYSLWIWNNISMTLSEPLDSQRPHRDYIGLFKGSLITRALNRIAIRKIKQLALHNLISEEDLH
jgi:hypothetical protein